MGQTQQELRDRRSVAIPTAAITAGAGADTYLIATASHPVWVTGAYFLPSAAVAVDDTNFTKIEVISTGTLGTGTDVIATRSTTVAGLAMVANVPYTVGDDAGAGNQTPELGTLNVTDDVNKIELREGVNVVITPAPASINTPAGTIVLELSTSPGNTNTLNVT